MLYSLTDKLKFNDDPQIAIKDKVITVKSDAVTVLKLLDVVKQTGEIEGAVSIMDLLLSEEDKAKVDSLNLKISDYIMVAETIIDLALGNDPEDEKKA